MPTFQYLKKLKGLCVGSVGAAVDLGLGENGFSVGRFESEPSMGSGGVLNGVSVVRSRFKNDGRVRPVVEGSEEDSGLSSLAVSGSSPSAASAVEAKDEAEGSVAADVEEGSVAEDVAEGSVGRNRLMKGRRLRFKGFEVVLLPERRSEMEISSRLSRSSMTDDVVEEATADGSVLRNRFKKFGRFRVEPSDAGGVVNGSSVLRNLFSSAWIGVTVWFRRLANSSRRLPRSLNLLPDRPLVVWISVPAPDSVGWWVNPSGVVSGIKSVSDSSSVVLEVVTGSVELSASGLRPEISVENSFSVSASMLASVLSSVASVSSEDGEVVGSNRAVLATSVVEIPLDAVSDGPVEVVVVVVVALDGVVAAVVMVDDSVAALGSSGATGSLVELLSLDEMVVSSDVVAAVVVAAGVVVAGVVLAASGASAEVPVEADSVVPAGVVASAVDDEVVSAVVAVGWNKPGFRLKILSLILVDGLVVDVVGSSPGILMSGNLVSGFKNGGLEPFFVVVAAAGSWTGSVVGVVVGVVDDDDVDVGLASVVSSVPSL